MDWEPNYKKKRKITVAMDLYVPEHIKDYEAKNFVNQAIAVGVWEVDLLRIHEPDCSVGSKQVEVVKLELF